MAMSAKEARRLRARVRSILAEGGSEYDICEDLDVTPSRARALVSEVLADEIGAQLSDTPGDTFARYKILADGMLEDLDDVILNGKSGKDRLGLNAVVAAVKAKHSISTDVLKLGQKLGIVAESPEPDKKINGVSTKNMKTSELREKVDKKRDKLLKDIREAGGGDYLSQDDGDLYADPEPDTKKDKPPVKNTSQPTPKRSKVKRKRA